jgi:pimeloyl-ACP methyl ester carboxylesterase
MIMDSSGQIEVETAHDHAPPLWPGRFVTVGEHRIFVRQAGHGGPPVVCVHGLEGSSANWTDLMAELAGEFSLDALDLPGFGYSPPAAGYSITAQAKIVAATIERLHDGPVHLVGNSLGGAVCGRLAARRLDLVRTVTLISPVLPDRWPHWELVHFPVLCVPGVGEWLLRRVDGVPAERRVRATAAFVYYDPAAIAPERLAVAAAELKRRDRLGYAARATQASVRALVAEVFGEALWRDAARVRAPALVIFGSHDRLVDPRLAGRAARTFPAARVLVMRHSGHVSQMEHPAKVANEIREWTRRLPG